MFSLQAFFLYSVVSVHKCLEHILDSYDLLTGFEGVLRVFGWCVWLSGLENINIWSCEPKIQHRESNIVYIHKQTNLLLIWRRHHYRWRHANFDLCSALVVIEQWGSLTCHGFCDTRHPFIMVISEDPWHSHFCRAFSSGAVTTFLYDFDLLRLGFEHPSFCLRIHRSNPLQVPSIGQNSLFCGLICWRIWL